MTVPICEHIKPSGKRCGSPALREQAFCYYHSRLEECLPQLRNMFIAQKANAAPGEWPIVEFPVPALEDAAAIQIGFMQALHGIANGNLDVRKAKLILSALHGASANLQRLEACLSQSVKAVLRKPPAGVKQAGRRVRKSNTVSL
jgi:hypothetical protein